QILQRVFRFSSVVGSDISVRLWENIGVAAVAFNKELYPVQNSLMVEIREYKSKETENPKQAPHCQQSFLKLKQMYSKADINMFNNFKFEDHKFESIQS
uniref:ATP synthase peripheral stalk subunit F6, mitochondrial n=1 Tax=Lynx canadensis TaxID=61383 RepID=A0A667HKW5_LYNCA